MKFIFILVATTLFNYQYFAQSTSFSALYNQRETLAINHLSYKEVELEIFKTGEYPSALVNKNISFDGIVFVFNSFRVIKNENSAMFQQRFKTLVPNVITFNVIDNRCQVTFSPTSTDEDFKAFFKILSYQGYIETTTLL